MKKSNLAGWSTLTLLGAIDGLVVGVTLEILRLAYERHRIELILEDSARYNKPIGYLLNPRADLLIPVICMFAFAGIANLVYRYFRRRPRIIPLLWLVASLAAISAGYVMTTPFRDPFFLFYLALLTGISYLAYMLWRSHPTSLPLLWQVIGVTAFMIVAATTQITGLFVVQRSELRRSSVWLLAFLLVLFVNFGYGMLLKLVPNSMANALEINRS